MNKVYAPLLAANDFALSYNLILSTVLLMKSMFFAGVIVSPIAVFIAMPLIACGTCLFTARKAWAKHSEFKKENAVLNQLETKLKLRIQKLSSLECSSLKVGYLKSCSVANQAEKPKRQSELKYFRKGFLSAVNVLGLSWTISSWISCFSVMAVMTTLLAPYAWPVIAVMSLITGTCIGFAKRDQANQYMDTAVRLTNVKGALKSISKIEQRMRMKNFNTNSSKSCRTMETGLIFKKPQLGNTMAHKTFNSNTDAMNSSKNIYRRHFCTKP